MFWGLVLLLILRPLATPTPLLTSPALWEHLFMIASCVRTNIQDKLLFRLSGKSHPYESRFCGGWSQKSSFCCCLWLGYWWEWLWRRFWHAMCPLANGQELADFSRNAVTKCLLESSLHLLWVDLFKCVSWLLFIKLSNVCGPFSCPHTAFGVWLE